jgi:hypothetical protein
MKDWRLQAACAGLELTEADRIFFPENSEDSKAWLEGKQICGACPVKKECLKNASAHGAQYGLWGGLTPQEREAKGLPVSGSRPKAGDGRKCGTYSKWNAGCRCVDCVDAKRIYTRNQMRRWRRWKYEAERNVVVHLPTYMEES